MDAVFVYMITSVLRNTSVCLAFLSLVVACVSGQQLTTEEDVKRMIDTAWKEVKARGPIEPSVDVSAINPGRRYSALLWRYYIEHPSTPAGGRAVVAALNLLIAIGDSNAAFALSQQIKPEDPAWDRLIQVLWRESDRTGEFGRFIERATVVLSAAVSPNIRARVGIFLGQAHWKQEHLDQARAAFEHVVADAPDSDDAAWAKGNLYEIANLGRGQPAPTLDARTVAGDRLSLSSLLGRIVLIKFWATW
jgi:hypothetical protein